MQIRLLTEKDEAKLDLFVANHPRGSIEQTWAWGVFQTEIPGRPAFYAFGLYGRAGELLGSMLVIRQEMGFGKSWLWCPRGPLLPKEQPETAWEMLQVECEKVAKKHGDLYLRVEPGLFLTDQQNLGGKPAKESYLPEHTLTIDLTKNEEDILKQMHQKGRYNIKQAEKAGVFVLKSKFQEFEEFYALLEETAQRDGFKIHDKAYYSRFLETLGGWSHLYLAHVNREIIGGILVTQFGNTATYYFGASTTRHKEKMAPYALQWFAMREAKQEGMKRYDFLGIAPENETGHVLAGVTQFKTRFGGEKVEYQKARLFVYRPYWTALVQFAKSFI